MIIQNSTRRVHGRFLVAVVSMITAVAQAQNENVTWLPPAAISGATNVSTNGTFYGSWAPYDGNANTLPVNGVVFQGYSSLPEFSTSGNDSGYNSYHNPDTGDTNYDILLQYATYASSGSGTITITWSDTPGHTYQIEAWANDGRGNGRAETFTGGANTSDSVVFGTAPGQYITGTYLADSSGSETITLTGSSPGNGNYPQINLLQIRDITSTVVSNYQSAVLADNPLAYFALNPAADPSGTSPDLTGNGNDGEASDITATNGPSPYITNAANFEAANDSFDDFSSVGANPGLLDFSGPITLEAWAQPSSSSEFADILAKGYDASSGDEIVIRLNGPYGADYFGDSGSVGDTGGAQTTNWTYVVLSSDGVNCSLYLNGALVVQHPDINGAVNFVDDWVIGDGSSAGNGRLFDGNISEVALYNYGLTAAQVLAHYYYGELNAAPSNSAPIITVQPQSQATYLGGSVTFSVSDVSAFTTTNQWLKAGVPIGEQTNSTLTLTNVQSGDATNYSVIVGNSVGTTRSAVAVVSLFTPSSLEWSGTTNSGVWDITNTADWINLSNSEQTVFTQGDRVLFNDIVGAPSAVTINETVSPTLITVDSSTNSYTFSGTGSISGSGGLNKEGSSTLTVDVPGNFTGPVTIGAGALVDGGNALGSTSSITVSNGATLDFDGSPMTANNAIYVSGAGLGGEGALYNSGGALYDGSGDQVVDITLLGNTTFGGSSRWDLAPGAVLAGNFKITINMPSGGYTEWEAVTVDPDFGDIEISSGGSLGIKGMGASLGDPSGTITVDTNATLTFWGSASGNSGYSKNIVVQPNASFGVRPQASTGTYFNADVTLGSNDSWYYYNGGGTGQVMTGTYYLGGIENLSIGDSTITFSNVISGPGGFIWSSYNNDLVFAAANTYTGPTVIGGGLTLELIGSGSISDSSLIFFGGINYSNNSLDVSGRSDQTLTLASGQTLAGIGGINGSLDVSADATISPGGTNGSAGSSATGTIAAADAITLNGLTVIKLDESGTNDSIQSSGGSITYGGTLNLVNISGSPFAVSNSFQIFSAPSYAGSFAHITPATPGSGLAWDTSQLNIGVLSVVAASSQLTINNLAVSGGNLVFSVTNGTASDTYYVLTTTNLTTPLTNWVRLTTNFVNANGSFSVTNAINPGTPSRFYRIEQSP
jgi:hypothetical protein